MISSRRRDTASFETPHRFEARLITRRTRRAKTMSCQLLWRRIHRKQFSTTGAFSNTKSVGISRLFVRIGFRLIREEQYIDPLILRATKHRD
jgi:hypothetical protein